MSVETVDGPALSAACAAERDAFGRDAGWRDMPPEPEGAPLSLDDVFVDFTPSPEDWRDKVFYSVLIDRFDREPPYRAWGDPSDPRARHGGNLRGVMRRLDYLSGLGVTALHLGPVCMNPPAGYHQYWPVHFMAVDPHLGTMGELRRLVAEAHRRGMHVLLDMVFNHAAPLIEYEGGFRFGPRKRVARWRYPLKPMELAREEHFSLRGDIADWRDPEQYANGDLPGGVNRLRTEHAPTQDALLKIAKWWIKETDADGFRLDAYPHVARPFWTRLFAEVGDYARRLGKDDFLFLGELFDGDPRSYAAELRGGRLGAAYNYPGYYWDAPALHGEAPTRVLEDGRSELRRVLGEAGAYMVNFLGNHDRPHFLGPDEPEGRLRAALALLMTDAGIPCLYGDEQAPRRVPGREWLDVEASREDRFASGGFKNPGSPADGFDAERPLYRWIAALARLRASSPALRRGSLLPRWSDPHGPGIYAFSRVHGSEEVLVAVNSSASARSARVRVDERLTPPGTTLRDELSPSWSRAATRGHDGCWIELELPAWGARVLRAEGEACG